MSSFIRTVYEILRSPARSTRRLFKAYNRILEIVIYRNFWQRSLEMRSLSHGGNFDQEVASFSILRQILG